MRDLIKIQKKLYPNLIEAMYQRYVVLQHVKLFQPIGRRALAQKTRLSERVVRGELEFLNEQGFVNVTPRGMFITDEGKLVVDGLSSFMQEVMGLTGLELQLKESLNVDEVIIVSGDSDDQDWVRLDMGKACVERIKQHARQEKDLTIGVTGGSTMAAVAEMMVPMNSSASYLFVPARGGLGEEVDYQANTIAAKMARKARGEYKLLHVPDQLSESSYQTMIKEPAIREMINIIKNAEIVIHGIGDALTMARRRNTSEAVIQFLEKEQAVSEAFGYYFNKDGQVVHNVRTIGIQMRDLEKTEFVMTVAGGRSKAEAIISYFKKGKSNLLITDEAAAKQVLRELSL